MKFRWENLGEVRTVDILTTVEHEGGTIKVSTSSRESRGADTQFAFKGGAGKEDVIGALVEILAWVSRSYSVKVVKA